MKKLTVEETKAEKYLVRGRYGLSALIEDLAKELKVGESVKVSVKEWTNKTNPNVTNLNKGGKFQYTTRTLLNGEGWIIIRLK